MLAIVNAMCHKIFHIGITANRLAVCPKGRILYGLALRFVFVAHVLVYRWGYNQFSKLKRDVLSEDT